MSNPDNLIRPPVLANTGTIPRQVTDGQANRDLDDHIRQLVDRLVQEKLAQGTGSAIETDQPVTSGNISELEKIPDIVRSLREFSGEPGEFGSWKKSVDRIIEIYSNIKGTARYYGILTVIRNKIIGNADVVLESYNTPLNWIAISRCLTNHYGDKRDLSTLEYQMTALTQETLTTQEFYQKVYSHFSLILNKLSCLDAGPESLNLLIQTYRNKALDTFVRGLNGDLPRLLGMREPTDLPQALQLCLKLENQALRNNLTINNFNRKNTVQPNTQHPIRKSKYHPQPFYPNLVNWGQQPQRHFSQRQPFYPPLPPRQFQNEPIVYNQQRFQPNVNTQQHYFAPPRPTAPKPQPKPEIMDIDQSMQTRRINYMNRPAQNDAFYGKRPAQSMQPNNDKRQRNFNIELQQYQDTQSNFDQEYDQSLAEYTNSIKDYETEGQNLCSDFNEKLDLTDIHFLE